MHSRKQDDYEKIAAVYMVGRRGQPKVNFCETQIFQLGHKNMDRRIWPRREPINKVVEHSSRHGPEQTTVF